MEKVNRRLKDVSYDEIRTMIRILRMGNNVVTVAKCFGMDERSIKKLVEGYTGKSILRLKQDLHKRKVIDIADHIMRVCENIKNMKE